MVEKARGLYEELRRHHAVEYDDSGAIGRRYRRQDEIGTPWGLTIDEQTLEDDTVTVRDRDSLAQERVPIGGARQNRRAARGRLALAEALLAPCPLEQALAGREAELLVQAVRVRRVQDPAPLGVRALVDGEADELGRRARGRGAPVGRRRRRGRRARRRARRPCVSSRRAPRRARRGRRCGRRGRSARPSPRARAGTPSRTAPR